MQIITSVKSNLPLNIHVMFLFRSVYNLMKNTIRRWTNDVHFFCQSKSTHHLSDTDNTFWFYQMLTALADLLTYISNQSHLSLFKAQMTCMPSELRSSSALSDLSLRCALSGKLRTQDLFMQTAKTLIRLGRCPGWSVFAGSTDHFVGFVKCRLILFQIKWIFLTHSQGDNILSFLSPKKFEPPYDRTNKMTCAPRDDRSVWIPAQSDQKLRCPHEETMGP